MAAAAIETLANFAVFTHKRSKRSAPAAAGRTERARHLAGRVRRRLGR